MSWVKTTIGEHCTVTSSKRFHLSDRTKCGVPFYCSKEIIQKVKSEEIDNCDYISEEFYEAVAQKYGVPQENDLLVTTRGTIGVPYLYKKSDRFYFADGNLTWMKDFQNTLLPQYLYYWFLSHEGRSKIDSIAKGTAQKAVPIAGIKNLELLLPPIEIQCRIADILSAYDDLIENNRKQIKLLEEAAQRLYKEWFVDLRFPGHKHTKIVDGVPEGWQFLHISDVCDTVGGGTPSTKAKEYYQDGKIPWVTPTDITKNNSLVLLDTATKITSEGLNASSAKMVPPGTILMTSRASVGFFGICDFSVCTNQGFISCIPHHSNMQMYLLYNLLNRVDEIRGKAGGSTYLEISKKTFRDFEIIVPNIQVLTLFQTTTEKTIERMRILSKQILELQQARDRLLPKLMSGEVEM